MIILGLFFMVLQALDLIKPNTAIKAGCVEANPLLKESLDSGFSFYMAAIKMGLSVFIIVLLGFSNDILNLVVFILNIFMGIVVLNNLVRILIQRKYNKIFFLESANLI